jgi:hypothetical protein
MQQWTAQAARTAMSATIERPAWSRRVEIGQAAEAKVSAMCLEVGCSVLHYGEARENAPVPYLQTPSGLVRPCDFVVYPPGGRQSYVVEVKSKSELIYFEGYGLDTAEVGGTDDWQALKDHDRFAGPVLLVIVDEAKNRVLAATVRMLADPGPFLSKNRKLWWWPVATFMPLTAWLRQ